MLDVGLDARVFKYSNDYYALEKSGRFCKLRLFEPKIRNIGLRDCYGYISASTLDGNFFDNNSWPDYQIWAQSRVRVGIFLAMATSRDLQRALNTVQKWW